jgi:hypothetical protein
VTAQREDLGVVLVLVSLGRAGVEGVGEDLTYGADCAEDDEGGD